MGGYCEVRCCLLAGHLDQVDQEAPRLRPLSTGSRPLSGTSSRACGDAGPVCTRPHLGACRQWSCGRGLARHAPGLLRLGGLAGWLRAAHRLAALATEAAHMAAQGHRGRSGAGVPHCGRRAAGTARAGVCALAPGVTWPGGHGQLAQPLRHLNLLPCHASMLSASSHG